MDSTRSGPRSDGEAAAGSTPTWTWRDQQGHGESAHASHASGEHGTPRTVHDDWAATSGFQADSAQSEHSIASIATGPGSSYQASDRSWATESTRARTPTDSDWDHHEQIDEQFENDRRQPTRQEQEQARFRRLYKARTCRICLEVIEPTFEFDEEDEHEHEQGLPDAADADLDALGGVGAAAIGIRNRVIDSITAILPPFLQPSSISASLSSMAGRQPRVKYVPEDPADGRLISPCHCKGSQKYVHEGCVQRWRHAQPLAERNFWKCPTCGFEYRIQRLRWGRVVSNRFTRAFLTVLAFLLTLFILGFIADPLMDLWSDPTGTIVGSLAGFDDLDDDSPILSGIGSILHSGNDKYAAFEDDIDLSSSWSGHFLKGFFSLGIVGVVKTFLMVSPFTWWNLRGAGFGRGRRRNAGGRDRFNSMGWVFILVGAVTFLGVSCHPPASPINSFSMLTIL